MRKHLQPHNLFFVACLLGLLTVQFARGLTGVSIGLFLIAGIWSLIVYPEKRKTILRSPIFWACVAWFSMVLLDVFKGVELEAWMDELMLKSAIVILPFSIIIHSDLSHRKTKIIIGSFVLSIALSASISSVNYLINMDEVNALLLQSKHVPIIAKIHHIYFGLFLGISTILGFWMFRESEDKSKERILWLIVLVVQFVAMNLLSSRTGLISFYAGIYLMAILYLIRMDRMKHRILTIGALIALPFISLLISPSLRHKVMNTKEDLIAVDVGGDDINYKSLAMRIEAWKMSMKLIQKAPLFGIGASNVEKELALTYEKNNTVLYEENRVGPHNQIIESTVAHGIVGGLLVMIMFIIPFVFYKQELSIYFIGIWAVLGTASLVESIFERQMGVLLFGIFYVWSLYNWSTKK
jgi:O-antigen ligase